MIRKAIEDDWISIIGFADVSLIKHDPNNTWVLENKAGVIVAIFGFTYLHAKVGQTWMLVIHPLNGCGLELTRWAIKKHKELLDYHDGNRVQCMILQDPVAVKWAMFLGYEAESVMAQAGANGEDVLMFRMLRR